MNANRRKTGFRSGYVAAGLAGALALGVTGCKSNNAPAPIVSSNAPGTGQDSGDPAAANMAAPYTGGASGGYGSGNSSNQSTQVLGASQSYQGQANGETYGYDQQQAAPVIRQAPTGGGYDQSGQGYTDAEEAGEQAIAETDQSPPPLPEYDQPPAPDPNYLWTPGYWNYAQTGYYWVPGAWCAPPFYGALWTPPYWGYGGGHYLFHRGYWGPHVGFYGGVDYGFGYIGTGYYGGYWRGHDFVYNRAVTNVNVDRIHNVYERPVVFNGRQYGPRPLDRVSYNGGRGGLNVQPRPDELAAAHEAHYPPVAAQRDARLAAASNRGQFAAANGGRPAQAFAARPVGTRQGIASAPQGEPFNRTGAFAAGARPGTPGGQPGFAAANHGAVGGQRPGEFQPGGQRPGAAPQRPAAQGGFERPGTAPGVRPGVEPQRPAAQGGFERPGAPPAVSRPGVTPGQPGGGFQRNGIQPQRIPSPIQRGVQPQRAAPAAIQRPQSAAPQSRPEFAAPRPAAPRPAASAPITRPAAPAPAARPEPAARPAPAPAARPAPAPHAAPASAPHGGGGGEHHR